MAKTRMLKTDQRRSEKVASWPIEVRYFWVLLWGYADDHGKGKDNPMLIKADCFPLDPQITSETVDQWMDILHGSHVIARYEVDGTRYFAIVNWKEHQKPPHPTPDVIPGPDAPGACARAVHEGRVKDSSETERKSPLGLGWAGSGDGSGSKGGDAQAASNDTPPMFCHSHPNGAPGACGPCGDQRRIYDAWLRESKDPPPPPRQVKHIPGLCDAHRQREGECEMCERESREVAEVIYGQFGAVSA